MANKKLFSGASQAKNALPTNEAGGVAYGLQPAQALAQLAATGTFNNVYYTSAKEQLDTFLALAKQTDDLFQAKLAIYARQSAFMKDSPAVLLALLLANGSPHFETAFHKVVQTSRMLRTFAQVVLSGQVGRSNLSSARVRRALQEWFDTRAVEQLFRDSLGTAPSLADIVKLSHVRFSTDRQKDALFGYLLDKHPERVQQLPQLVLDYEAFKNGNTSEVPNVPFEMLTSVEGLSTATWMAIAEQMTWTQLRKNLNTLKRHGVFEDEALTFRLAAKLADPVLIRRSKTFPYEIFTAYKFAADMPESITNALGAATEVALKNVPALAQERIFVLIDVSGSMAGKVTGTDGRTSSTKMRCIDVAALAACSLAATNPSVRIIPFDGRTHVFESTAQFTVGQDVLKNAEELARFGGGSTNCSLPLAELNQQHAKGDLVLYLSDMESWVDTGANYSRRTETLHQWEKFKTRNPEAKLVCIDIQPYKTSQAPTRRDVLNVGGFNDQVWNVLSGFIQSSSPNYWVDLINETKL